MTRYILNADDYAMTSGISDGILALAESGRLSSASAIVTVHHWPRRAAAIAALRDRAAVGLHLNLTFGAPLGAMPNLAPAGELPAAGTILRRAMTRTLNGAEIAAEIARQLDRFEEFAGFAPDFVDGHHHVHVLPGVRNALLSEMKRRFPDGGPLLRDPTDKIMSIARRTVAATKALGVSLLAKGFGPAARGAGFVTNRGFSGFSTFGATAYSDEFDAFLRYPGPLPMIMCHPGYPDDELSGRDSIARCRPVEQDYLARRSDLPALLWHPARTANSMAFPW